MRTLGQRVIKMEPASGFASQATAGATIYLATHVGYPLSTTHVISGSVMGSGAIQRFSTFRGGVAGNIVGAWALADHHGWGPGRGCALLARGGDLLNQ